MNMKPSYADLEKRIKELERNEANLKAVFNNIQQLFFTIDSDFKIITANDLAGYYVKDIFDSEIHPGKSLLSDFFSDEDGKSLVENIGKAFNGKSISGDYSITNKGVRLWFNYNFSPIREKNEEINSVVLSMIEVTERKEYSQVLQENESRLVSVFDTLTEGIILQDLNGTILDCNKEAEHILEYKKDEIVGSDFFDKRWKLVQENGRVIKKGEYPTLITLKTGKNFTNKVYGIIIRKEIKWISVNTRLVYNNGSSQPSAVVISFDDVTDQLEIRNKLKKSEEKYRSLIELSPDGIMTLGINGKILSVNKAFLGLTGFQEKEFIGKHVTKIPTKPKLIKGSLTGVMTKLLKGEKLGSIEFTWTHKDGNVRDGEARTRIMKEGQKIIGLQGVIRDITEMNRARKLLEESEEFLQKTGEMAKVGGWEVDLANRNVYWTKVTRQIHEVADDYQPTLDDAISFFNGESKKKIRYLIDQAINKGISYDEELEFKTAKGNEIWTRAIGYPEMKKGKCVRLYGTFQDITEQKVKELMLLEEKEKAQKYLDVAGSVFVIVDVDETIRLVNQAACKVLGYDKEDELIGKNWFETCIPEGLREEVRNVFSQLKSGNIDPVEYFKNYVITKSGEERIISWHNTVIRNEKNEITAILGSGEDITEIEKVQTELQRNYSSLQQAEYIGSLGYFERNWQNGEGFWSEGFKKLLGLKPDDKVPSHYDFMKYVHKEDVDRVTAHIKKTISEKQSMNIEFRLVQKNKNLIHIHGIANNYYDNQGKPLKTTGIFQNVTQRKLTDQKLLKSEENFKSYVNNSPVGIFVANKLGQYTFVNPMACEMLGYSEKELLKLSIPDIISEKDIKIQMGYFEVLLSEGILYDKQATLVKKDGSLVHILLNAVKLSDDEFMAFCTDISDRIKLENELNKERNKYENLVKNQGEGVGIVDANEVFTFVNPAACQIFNEPEENLVGHSLKEFVSKETYQMFIEESEKRSKGYENTYEFELIRRNGEKRIILLTATPSFDNHGKLTESFGIFRDITDRKNSEKQLIQSEEKYRTLVNSSLQGVIIAQNDPIRISFANPTMESITGYTVEELESIESEEVGKLIHPDDLKRFILNFQNRLKGKKVDPVVEYRLITKQGKEKWVQIYSKVIKYENSPATLTSFIDINERKQAQAALIESEEKFRSSFEASDVAMAIVNKNGEFISLNRAVAKMLKYSVKEFERLTLKDITHPDDLELCLSRFSEFVSNLKSYNIEKKYLTKNGEVRIGLTTISAVSDQNGELKYAMVHIQDITDRIIAENRLKESEEKYNHLVESSSDMIGIAQGAKLKFANTALARNLDYTVEEVLSIEFIELIYPEDRKMVAERYMRRLKGEDVPMQYSFRLLKKDGDCFWSEINSTFTTWNNEPAVLFFLRDIEERMSAERMIRESEEKYRSLVENINDFVYVIDREYKVVSLNKSASLLFGRESDQVIGCTIFELFPEEISKDFAKGLDQVFKTGQVLVNDSKSIIDGYEVDVNASLSPLKDENDEIVAVIGLSRDITEKKKVERLLEETYEIINQSPVVVFLWKNESGWPVEFVTDNVLEVMGYSKEEFMNADIRYDEIVHPEDLPGVFEEVMTNSEKDVKGFSHKPYRIVRKDGKVIWLDDRTIIRRDDQGNITHYQGIILDVTAEVASENALQESEKKFRAIFDNVNAGILGAEIETKKFLFANAEIQAITGYGLDELMEMDISKLHPEKDLAYVRDCFEKQVKGELLIASSIPVLCKNGEVRTCDVRSTIQKIAGEDVLLGIFTDVTEKREQEVRLQKSEEKFRSIFETAANLITSVDKDGIIVDCNNQIEEFLGYKKDEIVGQNMSMIIHPDFKEKANEILKKGFSYNKEYKMVRKDGGLIDVLINSSGINKLNGHYERTICIINDVTEQKHAEELLRESETRYRMITENANDVIWTCDLTGKFLYMSPSIKKFRGYTSEEAIQQSMMETLVGDSIVKAENLLLGIIERVQKGETKFETIVGEFEHPCKNGSTIWSETSVNVIFNKQGEFQFLLGVTRDISERRLAEQQIKSTNKKLENLISNLSGLVYRCYNDEEYTMTFLSEGCKRLTGYERDELLFSRVVKFKDIIHPEDIKVVRDTVKKAVKANEAFDIYYRIITKSKDVRWVWEKGRAIYNSENKVHRLEGYITDVTEEKESRLKIIESQAKFRELAELLPQAVFEINLKGDFTFLNEYSYKMFGYTQKEFFEKGNNLKLLFAKDEYERATENMFKAIQEQSENENRGYEYNCIKKDGTPIPVIVYTEMVRKEGKIVGIRGITVDISERKQAEREVQNLLNETNKQKDEITMLLMGARNVLENEEFEPTARKLFDYCKELIGAKAGYVALLNNEGNENEVLFLDSGLLECNVDESLPMPIRGLRGEAYRLNKAVYHNDYMNTDWAKYMPEGHVEMPNVLFAPLNIGDKTVGLLGYSNKPTDFTEDDARIASAFGELASIALRNSRNIETLIKTKNLAMESEEKFSKAFYNQPTPMQIIDMKKGIRIDMNDAYCDLSGYEREEIKGTSLYKMALISDTGLIKKLMTHLEKKGHISNYPLDIEKKSGEIRNVVISAAALSIGKGKFAIFSYIDITEEKRYNKQILALNDRLEASMLAGNMAWWEMELPSGNVIFNENKAYMLGYKPDKFKNYDDFMELVHPEDHEKSKKAMKDHIEGRRGTYSVEYRIKTSSGEYKWFWDVGAVKNRSNGIIKVVGIVTNVTERKLQELELKKAKEKAEESDYLKSAFLSNMSHEIRTPLNGIVGFAELLRTPDLPEDLMSKYIDVINSSGNQLLNIITDIVDISKIEANQIRIEKKAFNLNMKLNEIELFFSDSSSYNMEANVELIFNKALKDEESVFISDAMRFEQIVQNLIKNALKFTHKGFVKVGYEIVEDDVQFHVEDSGIGIPANKVDLIFDRFRQADDSHSRKYGGTGLGLSIAKSLVELLGGKIWVKSEEGRGTTFYFTLPYVTHDSVSLRSRLEKSPDLMLKGKKILIVEDEESSRQYYNAIFKPTRVELVFVETGREAIKEIEKQDDFNLVLMDIQLPEMNGYDATIEIRKMQPELPIIAQTANAFQEDRERALEAGCNEYIAKPINRLKLFGLIKKLIQ